MAESANSRAPAHLLSHRVAVERREGTSWAPHLSSVATWLEPLPGRNARSLTRRLARRWRAYVERGHDITASDRVRYRGTILAIEERREFSDDRGLAVLILEEVLP